jgi:GAF domain-containing protein
MTHKPSVPRAISVPEAHQALAPRPTIERLSIDAITATAPAYTELAKIVLGEQPLTTILYRIAELTQQVVPGADDVSVTLITPDGARTAAFTGSRAPMLDERQYSDGFGPCMDAAASGQAIMIEDTSRGDMYPGFSSQACRAGIHRTLSIGIITIHDTSAAINIYGAGPTGPFDQAAQDIATTFAGYAAVALLNAARYQDTLLQVQQMRQAMASRATIEQAKGILMRDRGCTPEEAFEILKTMSSQTHRKLRDVAQAVVETTFTKRQ